MSTKKINIFKITTSEHVGEETLMDMLGRYGEDIEIEFLEQKEIKVKKPPVVIVKLELPEEYKKLLTDIPYYKKYHLPGGTLRKCKTEVQWLDDEFEIGVNFEFGRVKENGWIEIYLLKKDKNKTNKVYGCVTDTTNFNHWREEYDVMLNFYVDKPPYDGDYMRVIVKG